jgi:hypothetical protein
MNSGRLSQKCRGKGHTATLIAVEIVRKNPEQVGFAVNPRRWVVERFFAWIGRNQRLAKDFEAAIDSARAFDAHNTGARDSLLALPGKPHQRAARLRRCPDISKIESH